MSSHVPLDQLLDQNPCTLRAAGRGFRLGCPLIPAYAGFKQYQLQLSSGCESAVTAASLWQVLAPNVGAHELAVSSGTVPTGGLPVLVLDPAEAKVESSS
jgi:hypothetical protein